MVASVIDVLEQLGCNFEQGRAWDVAGRELLMLPEHVDAEELKRLRQHLGFSHERASKLAGFSVSYQTVRSLEAVEVWTRHQRVKAALVYWPMALQAAHPLG